MRLEEGVLLGFEEDLVILGVVSLGQAGVGARVRVAQCGVGTHSGLEDAVEQPVKVGDRLRGVRPALRTCRVQGPGLPF